MITLEDIARQAGVSHSTVSRALADSPLVNAVTKKRIQRLAEETGYQVNQVARNLKIQSTRTIGLIVPEVSNPYYPKLVQLVADRAREAGYSLQLHLSGADQEMESACMTSLREHRVDGVLLVTAENGLVARSQVSTLRKSGTPLVLLGWVEGAEDLDMVTGDDARGGYELASHLLELGHRRFAILGKLPHRGVFDRVFGFKKALEANGVDLPSGCVVAARTDEDVRYGLNRLLKLPQPPTAIFAYQDSLAAVALKHLSDLHVSVPDELSVVGFDNLDLASYIVPRLTTVGQHIEPMAGEFVNLLLNRMRGLGDPRPRHIVVKPQVIVGDSSAPPPKTQFAQGLQELR